MKTARRILAVDVGGSKVKILASGETEPRKTKVPPRVRLGNNLTAFRGGYRLWGIDDVGAIKPNGKPRQAAAAAWRLL